MTYPDLWVAQMAVLAPLVCPAMAVMALEVAEVAEVLGIELPPRVFIHTPLVGAAETATSSSNGNSNKEGI